MSELPFMKFYPTDWRADPGLALCSLAARGLVIECLALMHDHGGYLTDGEEPLSLAKLAKLVRAGVGTVSRLMDELLSAKVFSRDASGCIVSHKMVRDFERMAINRANGSRGGNPQLLQQAKPVVTAPVEPKMVQYSDNRPDKAKSEVRSQNLEVSQSEDALGRATTTTSDVISHEDYARSRYSGRQLEAVLKGLRTARDPGAYLAKIEPDKGQSVRLAVPGAPAAKKVDMYFVARNSPYWHVLQSRQDKPLAAHARECGLEGRYVPTTDVFEADGSVREDVQLAIAMLNLTEADLG